MNKWEVLSQEMQAENIGDDVFMKERIAPDRLRQAYEAGRAVITERIVNICISWPTDDPEWDELGSLWVTPKLRDQKMADEIFRKLLEQIPPGKRCFIVSHNPRVVSLAMKNGFKEATREDWSVLAPYAVVCGPCDRLPDAEKPDCPFRAVHMQCRLFVR